MTKLCTKCSEEKDGDEFPYGKICKACRVLATLAWRKENPEAPNKHAKAWYVRNREKARQRAKELRQLNPERYKAYDKKCRDANREARNARQRATYKEGTLRRKYGLTLGQYHLLHKDQNNLCAICGLERKLVVDHNHTTNKVRQLLCHSCNSAIGLFQENIQTLQSAIAYLQKHESPHLTDNS